MKKLNYFSPLPPIKSGISDYSAELLEELQKYFDIIAYIDNNYNPKERKNIKIKNYKKFNNNAPTIYNIGNSEEHSYIYYSLMKTPGIVILHDENLEGLKFFVAKKVKEKLLENGWYQIEEDKGFKFRWTKKKVFFNINEPTTELILDVYTEYPATLTVFINKTKNKFKLKQDKHKTITIKTNQEDKLRVKLKISKPLSFISQIRDPHFRSMGIRIYGIRYKIDNEYKKIDLNLEGKIDISQKIVNSSNGIVTHSEYLKKQVKKINPKVPVKSINEGVYLNKPEIPKEIIRKKLGLEKYDFIICSFGKIQKHKRIEQALQAFSNFSKKNNSIYILIGESDKTINIKKIIKKYDLQKKVITTGYIDFKKAIEYIYSSDICINLRWPTTGGTSATLIKSLSIGTPCIITDLPENEQFPESCVFKIKKDEEEIKNIINALQYLKQNPRKQEEMSLSSLKYIEENHLWKDKAKEIADFVNEIYENKL